MWGGRAGINYSVLALNATVLYPCVIHQCEEQGSKGCSSCIVWGWVGVVLWACHGGKPLPVQQRVKVAASEPAREQRHLAWSWMDLGVTLGLSFNLSEQLLYHL